MQENWTDFEKWVFEQLTDIQKRISTVEGKTAILAGFFGVLGGVISRLMMK